MTREELIEAVYTHYPDLIPETEEFIERDTAPDATWVGDRELFLLKVNDQGRYSLQRETIADKVG